MFLKTRISLVIVTVFLTAAAVRADDRPTEKQSDREYVANLREATQQLVREIERLQEDIVAELGEHKERKLYQKADAVLAVLVRFEGAMAPEVKREVLFKSFDQMDGQLHELLQAIRDLGPEQRAFQRAAQRIHVLDEQVHYALFAGSTAEDRLKQLLTFQGRALAGAAKDLERTARYAMAGQQGKGAVEAQIHQLSEAAERFRKNLEGGASREQLKGDFTAVNEAWVKVVHALKDLPPATNAYLLRSAGQLDRLHERLYRLLGIEGKRPQLILRA